MKRRRRFGFQRLAAFLLTAMLIITAFPLTADAASAWDGQIDVSWYQGHENDTSYEIRTPAQLAGLAAIVNGTAPGNTGRDDFAKKTILLTTDLDLGTRAWTPIGVSGQGTAGAFDKDESIPFNGEFDGQGYAITNLKVSSETNGAALFGYAGPQSTIRSLEVSGSASAAYRAAGIAAVGSGTFEDLTSAVSVSVQENYAGGIVAEADGTNIQITDCHNEGKITNSSQTMSSGKLGGIVGRVETGSKALIKECSNSGIIEGYQYIGGIVGGQFGDADIQACYNTANLTGISFGKVYLGGISGKSEGGTISDCYNRGNLYDKHWSKGHIRAIGGIAGCEEGRADGATAITNCYTTGEIDAYTDNMVAGTNFIYETGNISGGNAPTGPNQLKYDKCFYLENRIKFASPSHKGYSLWADGYKADPTIWDTKYITKKTESQMKSAAFVSELGSSFIADSGSKNGGYPVLYWQAGGSASEKSYAIDSTVYGAKTVKVSAPETAVAGSTVTVSLSGIPSGKKVWKVAALDAAGKETICSGSGTSYTFTMPRRSVTLQVYIENQASQSAASYKLQTAEGLDAIWKVEADSSGKQGDTVKAGATVLVRITKDSGACMTSLEGMTASGISKADIEVYEETKDSYGNGVTGIYAFTMPAKDVTISPEASYQEFTVYTQAGEDGILKPVKSYSRQDMLRLATKNTAPLYFSGYASDKEGFIGKAEQAVTLPALLEDAGLKGKFTKGTSIKVSGIDGMAQTYSYDKLCGQPRYYYPNLIKGKSASEKAAGKKAIDAMFTIKGYMATATDGDVEKQICDTLFAYRFVFGQTEAEFNNGVPSVETKINSYMPKCTNSLVLITEEDAAAPGEGAWDGSVDVRWYNGHEADTSYTISTPAELAGLAAIVNGKLAKDHGTVLGEFKEASNYWSGIDDMKGKTITLTANLDMGGTYNKTTKKWSGPNYTPVGGQWCTNPKDVSTVLSTSFNGTFDGGGHTVQNIYCDRHIEPIAGVAEIYRYSQSIGLIGRLGCHDNDAISLRADSPTVKNVAVKGYFKGRRSIGGIVGKIGKTNKGGVISNCANFATIEATDKKGTGGIVGAAWNGGTIQNCYNAGAVKNSGSFITGGIAGSNEIKIINCYNIGRVTAESDSFAMALGTNEGGSFENCYWLTGTAAGGGIYNSTAKDSAQEVSAKTMQSQAFLTKLNGSDRAYVADETGAINSGYPVLRWQVGADTAKCTGLTLEDSDVKTSYIEGQSFDTTGITVWAIYEDGTREKVEELKVDPEVLKEDTKQVTVSCQWEGQSVQKTYSVTVTPKTLQSIKISKAPITTMYEKGTDFDPTGMIVTARFDNGIDETVTGYTVSGGENLAMGTEYVTISYTHKGVTKTCQQEVIVMEEFPKANASGIYEFYTEENLIWFVQQVNSKRQSNMKVVLTKDIVLTREWVPAGTDEDAPYTGSFDGQGHTVSGLKIEGTDTYQGFFGCTKGGEIKNLTVKGSISAKTALGGIIASLNDTMVSGCINQVEITGTGSYAGGIAAENNGGTIDGCRNDAAITSGQHVGGLVGENTGTVKNSYNTAAIEGDNDIGGLIGRQRGSAQNLYNLGAIVTNEGDDAGAIFGILAGNGTNKQLCYKADTCGRAIGQIQMGSASCAAFSDWALSQIGTDIQIDSLSAAAVMDQIRKIGTVTTAKQSAITAARSNYNALSAKGKSYVTNLATLTAAEKTLAQLQTAQKTLGVQTGVKAASASYSSIKVSWKKNASATGYEVYRRAGKAGTYKCAARVTKAKTISYTDKKLKTGTTYFYKVRSYKTVSGTKVYGSWSKTVSAKPALGKPVLKVKAGKGSAALSWKKVAGASGYQIQASLKKTKGYKASASVKKGSKVKYTFKKLKAGKTYYYKVRAYRKSGGKTLYGSYSKIQAVKVK